MTNDFETHPIGTAAELEQLRARVARLEDEMIAPGVVDVHRWRDGMTEALNESPRKSAAEIEARALERLATSMGEYLPKGSIRGWLRSEANRIREQANEIPKRQS